MTTARRPRSARGSGSALRDEILQAARELLAHTGNADAVSIREVSRRVGVSAPSIYRHFIDKDALIEAVVAQVFENLDAAIVAATDPALSPIVRMRQQGLAYVRFALEHPEQYRIATVSSSRNRPRAVDQVLGSAVFRRFSETIREAMDTGLLAPGDPLPVVLQMWASAHGIVSLMIAKPYLPWGDPEIIADRVLAAAFVGRAALDIMGGDPGPEEAARWLDGLRDKG
ncbi:TetR/AcrR family transcriptional regulator [Nocardia transvalensis]|uniref:TetR/AcrR family transcriptional regulator n=1 Tax=Nocardia transvalensis TaxID=37333 RepID=UPI001892F914|nr:TetR/AcrR family transcriptional regulator [Nocardia transvalensis]MBF6333289.1 TetR/AcrR family transcriptional regulator [Nocardia transvalensis]